LKIQSATDSALGSSLRSSLRRMRTETETPFDSLRKGLVNRAWPSNASAAKAHVNKFIDYYNLSDGPLDWDSKNRTFEIKWSQISQEGEGVCGGFGALNTMQNPELLWFVSTWDLSFMTVKATFDPSQEKVKITIDVNSPWRSSPIQRIYFLDNPVTQQLPHDKYWDSKITPDQDPSYFNYYVNSDNFSRFEIGEKLAFPNTSQGGEFFSNAYVFKESRWRRLRFNEAYRLIQVVDLQQFRRLFHH